MRSLLFVPGSDTRKLGKVARFGADAIVIDLEDAVADEEKVGARVDDARGDRRLCRAALRRSSCASTASRRACSTTTSRRSSCEGVDAIMVPKVESADTLAHLDAPHRRGRGRPPASRRARSACSCSSRRRAGSRDCDAILAGAPDAGAHRRLRCRRLLRAARHRPDARGHRGRLRALAPRRRRARGGPRRADRRPLAAPRGRRGPRGRQPALPRPRLPGPRDRLPAAGRDGPRAPTPRSPTRRPSASAGSSRRSRRPSRGASPRCASTAASSTTRSTAWRRTASSATTHGAPGARPHHERAPARRPARRRRRVAVRRPGDRHDARRLRRRRRSRSSSPSGDNLRTLGWEKDGVSLWWALIGRNKRSRDAQAVRPRRRGGRSQSCSPTPTCSSRTSAPARSSAGGSAGTSCTRSTRPRHGPHDGLRADRPLRARGRASGRSPSR